MLKKAFAAAITVIAIEWMCFVIYCYFLAHPVQLQALRVFNTDIQFLAIFTGFYIALALVQRFYRGRNNWNFGITPMGLFAAFAAVFLTYSGYLYQSGVWRNANIFLAELNVMGWFGLISASLFLLATFFHVLGEMALHKYKFHSPLDKFVLATGAGMMTTVAAIFVLSQAHLLYTLVAWSGVLAVLVGRFKSAAAFWRQMFAYKILVKTKPFSPVNFLFLFLMLVMAMNFIAIIRPIPLGFDDSILYLNYPKLSAHYHHLLNGGGYNYTPIATFFFLLFDNDTLVLFAPFFGGFCGVFAVLALARRFFSFEIGLLGATVLYLTPMITWQSTIDLKSDQTLFYFVTLAVYSMFEWITQSRPKEEPDKQTTIDNGYKWLVLGGIFAGFCIGIKFTAIPMVFGMTALITLMYLGWSGALAIFFLFIFIVWKGDQFRLWGILQESQVLIFAKASLVLALAFGLLALVRHRTKILEFGLRMGVFVGLAALTFSPWAVTNAIATKSLSLGALLSGSVSSLALDLQKINADYSLCTTTGSVEELGRVLGSNKGVDVFLALPWITTLNSSVNSYMVDVGFVFLALLPAFLGLALWRREENMSAGIAALAWFTFWIFWVLRITRGFTGDLNVTHHESNLVFDYGLMFALALTAGYYAFSQIRKPVLTATILLVVVSWFFWMLVGSGVIWYGLPGFLPLIILLGYLVFHSPPLLRVTGWLLIFIALATQFVSRDEVPAIVSSTPYAYGAMDYNQAVERDFPSLLLTADIINKNPESSIEKNYVYRVGTSIAYHIQENDRRVYSDSQLDLFNCLSLGQSDEDTYNRMKALGFRYIVFSRLVASFEKNPNGSLHQKAYRFLGWANRMHNAGKINFIVSNGGLYAFLELI
jgi:hypothetical protein